MITIEQGKTFEIIKSAVDKLVDFAKPTYGPASNKVIINKQLYSMAVDDGVQIARDFELEDPAENAVVKLVKETAIRTNDRAGDGTTSSLIMLQAIISEAAKKTNRNGRKIEKELQAGLEDFRGQIMNQAVEIKTKEQLKKVAMVSFDDEDIAEKIADLFYKLGKDAIVTIDKSPTMETYVELTDGVKLNSGYISPYMILNPERMETVIEKPYILITDYRLTEASDVLPVMEMLAENNVRELVIIAENVEQKALATLVVNRMQNKFFTVAVVAPKDKVELEDLAIMTGAKVFTETKGNNIENATIDDLGRAERFISRREESVIVEPKGTKKDIQSAISSLKVAISLETKEKERKALEKRLASFTNSLAVLKVGAPTENEQKALKYKIEDAVNSVKAAYKNGVVRGSGLALASIESSSHILNEALKYPARQLRDNMGLDEVEFKKDEAQNVVTGEIGNFMKVGVVDPVDALVAGVESAVSIASVLLTSSGIIVESADKE